MKIKNAYKARMYSDKINSDFEIDASDYLDKKILRQINKAINDATKIGNYVTYLNLKENPKEYIIYLERLGYETSYIGTELFIEWWHE